MKQLPFDKAVPPTSERFHRAMEYALDHLAEEKPVKKTARTRLGLALALVLALALMATAFALTDGFGILEYFREKGESVAPLESAQALVQRDLGSAEKYGYRLRLSEAVYTGPNVLLMLDVTVPEDAPLPYYSCGVGIGHAGMAEEGRVDLAYDLIRHCFTEGPELPEGVTCRIYMEALLRETPPEEIEADCSIPVPVPGNRLSGPRETSGDAFEEELELIVRIPQTRSARSAAFTPDAEEAGAAGLEFVSLRADYTDLEAVLTIEYILDGARVDQPLYGTPHGTFFHTDPNCQGMKNAAVLEDLTGKRACPFCVSNDASGVEEEWYRAEGSPYIHLDPGCALLEGLEALLCPEDFDAAEFSRCPVCGRLERRVRFHPLDERGGEIATASIDWQEVDSFVTVDAGRRLLRTQTLRMQTAEEIPAVLLLAVEETSNDPASASGGTICAPIRCERVE